MKIHILGICGTFMGGLAQILQESGHEVSGTDLQFYPPMSDQLNSMGITLISGYESSNLPKADLYVIGNALSRGNESVEYILNEKLPFKSGPEILGEILKEKNVIAVSGTHGKTTTAYMIAHILKQNKKDIGYLVGGISPNFKDSASLGSDNIFVIEADEYDSAFFDKRSKFIHYSPNTLLINNIEFDHADIFKNIDDIKKQFHHLIKIIPSQGNVIYFAEDKNSHELIKMGSWSKKLMVGEGNNKIDYKNKDFYYKNKKYSLSELPLIGDHNFKNYVSAIIAASLHSIPIENSINALKNFEGVKRRLEFKGAFKNIKIYDDFAHHPTAIAYTSNAIRTKYKNKKILALIELGSNTMSSGYHGNSIIDQTRKLDNTLWLDYKNVLSNNKKTFNNDKDFIESVKKIVFDYDIILLMTNKNSQKLLTPLIKYIEKE
ncbi:MAG: UDP-N-acetylmuramate:L-alanyl-gamma-D-glutamyl-meso-diaminopimelate ligase [SAR86 cluster bacterium]|jgi:UDP-N-acetylmuramate: L-alanyl-gamma-D-glutamyl-meso-diaminopimelate ligase|nr:MAG: UDP-N-acetylmuramate:L-alanyl-gamma-D-glutamyl-meso-diaminopimelate ligase [SAR86 cluster bacterium]